MLIAGLIGLLEVLAQSGAIDPLVMPAPSEIAAEVVGTVQTSQFAQDLGRTMLELGAACAIGISCGLLIGTLCWRIRLVGDVAEPYLVTLYAVPTLVFYPVLVAIMGLGSGPVIALTTVLVVVPVALNTMLGFRSINPTVVKMARTLKPTPWQLYRKVLMPAATPLVLTGIRLGIMYGVIGTIAMEFMIAQKGLGFRIGYDYSNFAILEMWAGIVVVIALAIGVVGLATLVERRVRRDLA